MIAINLMVLYDFVSQTYIVILPSQSHCSKRSPRQWYSVA